jgi:hypothetical protein
MIEREPDLSRERTAAGMAPRIALVHHVLRGLCRWRPLSSTVRNKDKQREP